MCRHPWVAYQYSGGRRPSNLTCKPFRTNLWQKWIFSAYMIVIGIVWFEWRVTVLSSLKGSIYLGSFYSQDQERIIRYSKDIFLAEKYIEMYKPLLHYYILLCRYIHTCIRCILRRPCGILQSCGQKLAKVNCSSVVDFSLWKGHGFLYKDKWATQKFGNLEIQDCEILGELGAFFSKEIRMRGYI